MNKFIQCPRCTILRSSRTLEDTIEASTCHQCSGTGFIRSRESYICNQCGGPLCTQDYPDGYDTSKDPDFYTPNGLVEHSITGGYSSTELMDLTTYTFSLCERCLRNLFNQFKIPPHVSVYNYDKDCSYSDDLLSYNQSISKA